MKKKKLLWLILPTILLFISIFFADNIYKNMNFGLDLKGGFEVLYEVSPLNNDELTSDMVYSTYKTLVKRIDVLGVSEPEITIEGKNRIRIRLAGVTDSNSAKQILQSTASITFRDASDNLLMTSEVLGGSVKLTTDNYGRPAVSLPIKDKDKFYKVTNEIKDKKENVIVIWLDFDEEINNYHKESSTCGSLSTSNCLSAAMVNEAFKSDVIIQGNFTKEEATNLVELINSGAMPTKLEELSSRLVDATFGEKSLEKTIFAGAVGLIIVILILIAIYHFSGLIAAVNLVFYTFASFLIYNLIGGVLTLPGIAAMLLGIGMAVDTSIISFERVKDELKKGLPLPKAFIIGNKESLSSIIDANVTTIIVAIILFTFGESAIKGFATMLIINIILTILIMMLSTKIILSNLVSSNYFNDKLNLYIGITKKQLDNKNKSFISKLDIIKPKNYLLIGTLILIIIGSFFFKDGLNLGVEFKGGTDITVNYNDKLNIEVASEYLNKNYTIEKIENYKDNSSILLKEVLNETETNNLINYFKNEYNTDIDVNIISNIVKKELTINGIKALLIAMIGIIIYVSIRFKFSYAISGIVALVHDVLITFIFFAIFKIEITSIFIAAILTIIGYSINDTIVTFDRIRSTYNKAKDKKDLDIIVNTAVRATFTRTLLTTLTTLIPVLCLIFLGASEIINFNIALLVGFIAGVYSSIFISNSLWYLIEKNKKIKKPKDKDKEPDELMIKGINY